MNISEIKDKAIKQIVDANDLKSLEKIRIKYLGRKGEIAQILRSLKDLPIGQRRKIGPQAQQLKKELGNLINQKKQELTTHYSLLTTKSIDITKPGEKIKLGHLHPISKIEEEIRHIFLSMNFSAVEGPEIEDEEHNFDALNIPPNHPARDMWDTLWLRQKSLLRTHTSPVQIRYMETHNPPFQIIAPGVVYRHEATDATHEFQFSQLEGLMVGKDVSLANFKFIIEEFFKKFFSTRGGSAAGGRGQKIEFRFVPSYYPFVEPGLDIAIKLKTKDSKLKTDAWLEVAGAGMVHRKVFEAVGYNPYEWQGFAFGFGVTRLAMIKYNIPDIRLFNSGDLRFIKQF